MTPAIRKLFKQCHRLHKRKQRTNNPNHIKQFKDKRKEAKNAFKQSKILYYQNISDKLTNQTTLPKTYWKLTKAIYGTKQISGIPTLIDKNLYISNDQEKADLLNDYFVHQSLLPTTHTILPPLTYITQSRLSTINITPEIVWKLLLKLDTSKATGPDCVSNKLLKSCADSLCFPLSELFNKSMKLGIFPNQWKTATVTAIFKKNNRQIKENYRPISLLSCISKVFEKIVFNQLYQYCTDNDILSDSNSGFRPNDSAINRLLHITDNIYKGLNEHNEILLVFLDISKAFDKVWHEGLLHKLKTIGICGHLLAWFTSYLDNRKQKVVLNGKTSSIKKLHAGVPQGSILGPLLFLIFINDISSNLASEIHQFADDTTLLDPYHNPTLSAHKINADLKSIENWAAQWKVTFNAEKTHYMKISLKTKSQQYPPIIFKNKIINEISTHTNLGLTFNNKMTWTDHINRLIKKASIRISTLHRIRNKLPRQTLVKIYTTMIRPILEYADIIYTNTSLQLHKKLETIQRRAAIICTGAYKHTELNALLTELGWNRLMDRAKHHKTTLFYKMSKGLCPTYLTNMIPPTAMNTHQYNLRNRNNRQIPNTRLSIYAKSFIPSASKIWNTLPPSLRNTDSLSKFKNDLSKIFFPPIVNIDYNRLCIGNFPNKDSIRLECIECSTIQIQFNR